MVQFYVKRIQQGKMTLDEVPAKWYEQVKAIVDPDPEPNDEPVDAIPAE